MKNYRQPTKLEREWLSIRAVCIRCHRALDAGIFECGSEEEDDILRLLADASYRESQLQREVSHESQRRYVDFLCGRRKTNRKLDPRYFIVRHPRGEAEGWRLLLKGREQPIVTFR